MKTNTDLASKPGQFLIKTLFKNPKANSDEDSISNNNGQSNQNGIKSVVLKGDNKPNPIFVKTSVDLGQNKPVKEIQSAT